MSSTQPVATCMDASLSLFLTGFHFSWHFWDLIFTPAISPQRFIDAGWLKKEQTCLPWLINLITHKHKLTVAPRSEGWCFSTEDAWSVLSREQLVVPSSSMLHWYIEFLSLDCFSNLLIGPKTKTQPCTLRMSPLVSEGVNSIPYSLCASLYISPDSYCCVKIKVWWTVVSGFSPKSTSPLPQCHILQKSCVSNNFQ